MRAARAHAGRIVEHDADRLIGINRARCSTPHDEAMDKSLYDKYDVPVPLRLEVKWAGDTPIITLTNFTIPVLGTFTSRVVIYNNKYAGTWTHGKAGGHLFGRIVKMEAEDDAN